MLGYLLAIFVALFLNVSAFASIAQERDFNKLVSEYFAPLGNKKLSQEDVQRTFERVRDGVVRFQIVDNEIYYITKEINGEKFYARDRVALMVNFLKGALQKHKIRNVDFLVSLHDDGERIKFDYDRIVPIFVFAKNLTNKNYPIKIPFVDFDVDYSVWSNAIQKAKLQDEYQWKNKLDVVYWRGSTTGQGYNIKDYLSQPRVKLVDMSTHHPLLIDAKFVAIVGLDGELHEIIEKKFGIVSRVDPTEQLKYKYLINMDGHTCTYPGFLWRLVSNSVVFKQETNNFQWFYPLLKPWVHYVPIKEDLSDLVEKIEYAKLHDKEMEEMSLHTQEYVGENLDVNGMQLYAAMTLNKYAEHQDFELTKPSDELKSQGLKDRVCSLWVRLKPYLKRLAMILHLW